MMAEDAVRKANPALKVASAGKDMRSACLRPMSSALSGVVGFCTEHSEVSCVCILILGMGLIKPIFAAEAKLQGQLLGAIAQVSMDDVVAEIEEAKAQVRC